MNFVSIEMLKLRKKKSTRFLTGFYLVGMLLMAAIYAYAERVVGLQILNAGQFTGMLMDLQMALFLPVLAVYAISESITSEMRSGTLLPLLLQPAEKWKIYGSKILSVLLWVASLLGIQFLFSILIGTLLDGVVALPALFALLLQYASGLLILGLLISIGAALAVRLESTGPVFLVGIALLVAYRYLPAVLPWIERISIPVLLDGYASLFTSLNLQQLFVTLAYYTIALTAGILLFDKKEANQCQSE